jgi:hypothetical protein
VPAARSWFGGGFSFKPFQTLIVVCAHLFQLLLKLLVTRFQLFDLSGKLCNRVLKYIQSRIELSQITAALFGGQIGRHKTSQNED